MESQDLPKVLIISSLNPLVGVGVGAFRLVRMLKDAGLEVDLLTLNSVEGYPDVLYVNHNRGWKDKVHSVLNCQFARNAAPEYHFFYRKENFPPVRTKKVLEQITKPYDLVVIWFWQRLLSFETIEAIFDKLHCVFFFLCADYSPMSGGCHFTGDCERFTSGCGKCPAFHSTDDHDFTWWNVKYRKRIYEKVKPVVIGNSYMKKFFFDKSYLLKSVNTIAGRPHVMTNSFYPLDVPTLREKYNIDSGVEFIIGFGAQIIDDPRKGFEYLKEALFLFSEKLNPEERSKILLLSIGKNGELIKNQLPFKLLNLGYIPSEELPEFYSLADVFVCPSVNDAGPSMVGQAIACGTPVVGFEMGALLDWVKGKGTGFCSSLRDSDGLADSIQRIYTMTESERSSLSNHCRKVALSYNSKEKVKEWLDLYYHQRLLIDNFVD